MVPLNCFYDIRRENSKDRFIYYDQEFYWENCPAKAILHRSLSLIYDGTDKEFEQFIPRKEIMDRFGLTECEDIWSRMSSKFTQKLRNQAELETYYRNRRVNARICIQTGKRLIMMQELIMICLLIYLRVSMMKQVIR